VDGQARLGLQRWCPMGVFPFRLRDQRFPQAPLQLFPRWGSHRLGGAYTHVAYDKLIHYQGRPAAWAHGPRGCPGTTATFKVRPMYVIASQLTQVLVFPGGSHSDSDTFRGLPFRYVHIRYIVTLWHERG
jgi:hypothetical protein